MGTLNLTADRRTRFLRAGTGGEGGTITPPEEDQLAPDEVSGLQAWWDFSDSTQLGLTGSLIDLITDKSGNGRDLISTGSERPTLTAGGLGGKSVATFAGSHAMQRTGFIYDLGACSIFVVGRHNVDVKVFFAEGGTTGASNFSYRTHPVSNPHYFQLTDDAASNRFAQPSAAGSLNTPYLVHCADTGTTAGISLNGAAISMAAYTRTGGIPAVKIFRLGARRRVALNDFFMTGYIAEMFLYSSVKTGTDLIGLTNYAMAKWGL